MLLYFESHRLDEVQIAGGCNRSVDSYADKFKFLHIFTYPFLQMTFRPVFHTWVETSFR